MNMELLGNRIRDLRTQSGLTQEDVANKLGISRQAYIRTEQGNRDIPMSEIYALARLFQVPYQEITDIADDQSLYSLPSLCRNEDMSDQEEVVISKVQHILEVFSAQEMLYLRFSEREEI